MTPDRTLAENSVSRVAAVAGLSLAACLLAGCSGMGGIKSATAAPLGSLPGKADAKADRAIVRAEAAVAKSPEDAATRAALGNAYLSAGRFVSATTAYDDAMTLGDNSGRTALSLALAKIGSGQHRDAVAILDDWRAEIPASDLGLALALAGETSRGVAVLADAVRSGESTPKLRQNLAYAYALDGRWNEAKLMAAQDVPAEQLDKRLAFWALSMLPDRNVERVAAMIGAPVRATDPGQPESLALKADPAAPLMAEQGEAPTATFAAAAPAPQPELALAVAAVAAAPVWAPAQPAAPERAALAANLAAQQHRAAPRITVAQAFVASAPAPARMQPARPAHAARPRSLAVSTLVRPVAGGSHLVQLGSFSSQQGARRAWGIYTHRDPGLAAYRMTITPATVKGKQVWRVAAGGLSGRMAANTLCSRVKSSGGACFAYALQPGAMPAGAVPRPGAPTLAAGGMQRARR